MYCLDTNAAIAILKGSPPQVIARMRHALAGDEVALSCVVLYELHDGAAKSARRTENEERLATLLGAPIAVLAFDAEDAREAGDIRAVLAKARTPIGPYDILIAAQARRRGATLVTAHKRQFARVPRLQVEDWTAP